MKKRLFVVLLLPCYLFSQTNNIADTAWKPAEFQLQTRWSKEVSPTNALPEYPRPQMVRKEWTNLNGLWDYAINDSPDYTSTDATNYTNKTKEEKFPEKWDGKILVPYPIESALSGVRKSVQPGELLWYRKELKMGNGKVKGERSIANGKLSIVEKSNERVLLHFGAVDWQTTVYLNKKQVGKHTGGYGSFTIDITDALKNGDNELLVKVYDPTDQGPNPHGKQALKPENIWYTPVTGLWQTVWLETVPRVCIQELKLTPDVDQQILNVGGLSTANPQEYTTEAIVKNNGKEIARKNIRNNDHSVPIPNAHLWSPEDPFLYELTVRLLYKGKPVDEVTSYFGMRKVEIKKTGDGYDRIFLNNKYVFNLGVLDQGFWPDGIYTAPTDEALAFDIKVIKAMGFNTVRKHIKREPDRWYYHCDKLGMIVWQDMINPSFDLSDEAKKEFEIECEENIKQLYNHPCITTWVLFNEKWGQYDQQRLTEWIKKTDPSRLVNGHSGEILYVNEQLRSPSPNAYISSDITDIHSYPDPMNALQLPDKARVLGEFGGIGVFIPDHQWNANNAWGYVNVTPAQLKWKYSIMNQHLKLLEKEGLSASIYTQPFDVEGEQNGLITYDREVIKIPFEDLRKTHSQLVSSIDNLSAVNIKNADVTEPIQVYTEMVQQYINGKTDAAFLKKLAMMAGQTNDAAGRSRFGGEYIASLKKPYDADDIAFVEGNTKKVADPGFAILIERLNSLRGSEQRTLRVKIMNMILKDVIAPYVPNGQAKPDWNEIAQKIKPYGETGEEVYLRAKTIHTFNQQDWDVYKVVAKEYLQKYGSNINADERKMFEEKLQ